MLQLGASAPLIVSKLAGGADMFGLIKQVNTMQIGRRNVEQSLLALTRCSISVVAQDVGGSNGRTIVLDCDTGVLAVRTAMPRTDKEI